MCHMKLSAGLCSCLFVVVQCCIHSTQSLDVCPVTFHVCCVDLPEPKSLCPQAMLLPVNFPAVLDPVSESTKLGIQNIFAFCYVWSIGGALESHSRDAFDAMVRSTFQGVAIFPAGAGLVYDYHCDPQRY